MVKAHRLNQADVDNTMSELRVAVGSHARLREAVDSIAFRTLALCDFMVVYADATLSIPEKHETKLISAGVRVMIETWDGETGPTFCAVDGDCDAVPRTEQSQPCHHVEHAVSDAVDDLWKHVDAVLLYASFDANGNPKNA